MPHSLTTNSPGPPQPEPPRSAEISFPCRTIDVVAFSNGLPAIIAASLSLAASHALGASDSEHWALLAASGTFAVYGFDRLRDTARDRKTSPLRTHFVESHARAISIGVGIAALALGAGLVGAPRRVVLLCLAVGAIGLLHRRLKGHATLKSIYVSAAWVAICAGIPGITVADGSGLAWVGVIFFTAISANLAASNLGEDEAGRPRRRPRSVLRLARALAVAGVLVAMAAPPEIRPLGWIPLVEALALVFFRPSEYFGHLAVDGALLAGALTCLLQFALF